MENEELKCQCGKESDVGTHVIEKGEVVNVYYCVTCYNQKGKSNV